MKLREAFGMKIYATKKHPSERMKRGLDLDFLGNSDDLAFVLQNADFLVVSVVLTPETRHLLGAAEIALIKPLAYLINVARGSIIDEEALSSALKKGQIAGAGLDVFSTEPLQSNSPLLQLKTVVLTPHVGDGGGAKELMSERGRFIARNISKWIRDGHPVNLVDPTLHYVRKK